MLLEDTFADIKLFHKDGEAFEVWWFYDSLVLAVSHSPNNYPSTVVHSMGVAESIKELSKLLTEGWVLDRCSVQFLTLWHSS